MTDEQRERQYQKEILHSQHAIMRLLKAYVATGAYLCFIFTLWFLLRVTGHI